MTSAPIHCEVRGEGRPALVFVHGLCCSTSDWRHQVERFAPDHATLACDLRGHGASTGFDDGFDVVTSGADVADLLRTHALAPAVLVGHSMGCRVVLEAARRAPEVVAGLVLVDGSLLTPDPARPPVAVPFTEIRERTFEQMFPEGSDPGLRAAVVARALAVPGAVAESFFRSMIAYDAAHAEAALAAVVAPLAVVQSTYLDAGHRRVSLESGMRVPLLEAVERLVPGARIDVVARAGHFTMLEAPDAVNRSIETLLGEL